jgi:hypothetical protein
MKRFVCALLNIIVFFMCVGRPKKWDEHLERPHLDYSEIFDSEVGHIPGTILYSPLFTCMATG